MKNKTKNNQITGNTGLFYVCYHLSRLGWNVIPTSRNAKGIDIVIYNENAKEYRGIQVKSLSKRNPVPLGNNLDRVMGDFWIIVNNLEKENPSVFILTPEEIKKLAFSPKKNGRVSCWLQPNDYDKEEFRNAWKRLESETPNIKHRQSLK